MEVLEDNILQEYGKKYNHTKYLKLTPLEKEYCFKFKEEVLEFSKKIDSVLKLPSDSKHNESVFELRAGERVIIFKLGNILDEKGDVLVNPVNRLFMFDDKIALAGLAGQLAKHAGVEFVNECEEIKKALGSFSPGDCIETGPGLLKNNFKKIYNSIVYPEKDEETNENVFKLIEKGLRKIFFESKKSSVETLVLPLIYTGAYNFNTIRIFEIIMSHIEEFVLSQPLDKNPLKKVIICENVVTKVNSIKQYVNYHLKNEDNFYVPENQWFWFNDIEEFEAYDEDTNREIDRAFRQKEQNFYISFPSAKKPGTHLFNLVQMRIINIALGEEFDLNKDISENRWAFGRRKINIEKEAEEEEEVFEVEEEFDMKISEMIEYNFQSRITEFDLFLNEYKIDFEKNLQINKNTEFEREIKKEKFKDEIKNKKDIECSEKTKWVKKYPICLDFSNEEEKIVIFSNNDKADILVSNFLEQLLLSKGNLIKENITEKYIYSNKLEKIKSWLRSGHIIIKDGIENLRKSWGFTVLGSKKYLKKLNKFLVTDEKKGLKTDLYDILPGSNEWKLIEDRIQKEAPKEKLKSLKIVCSDPVFKRFNTASDILYSEKTIETIDDSKISLVNELLWHGSGVNDPKGIYEAKGFLLNFANEGLWGKGIYFAENIQYSVDYAFKAGDSKILLLCDVILGKFSMEPQNSKLKLPPIGFDSVQGKSAKGYIYVLYQAERAYPKYIVELGI